MFLAEYAHSQEPLRSIVSENDAERSHVTANAIATI